MSVQNATILAGPTISVTGGTSKAYTPSSQKVINGINIVDTTAADYRTRPNISIRASEAQYDRSGVCVAKAIRKATATRPKILASGSLEFPCVEITLKIHPETTDAEILALIEMGVQLLTDVDFENFRKFGSIL